MAVDDLLLSCLPSGDKLVASLVPQLVVGLISTKHREPVKTLVVFESTDTETCLMQGYVKS